MPEASAQHPSSRELADFGAGKLPHEQAARVAAHLTACGDCSTKLEQAPVDSFVGQLKAAAPQDLPPSLPPAGVPAELLALGKFEVLEKLGQGGMGAVYKARHNFLGKLVAIKVMKPALGADDDARARFLREMRATARLRHPHLVQALDAEEMGSHLVLVMEYVEGITLDRLVKQKGPFPAHYACRFVSQAAEGLQHAHEQGLVHRDVKPSNLMVSRDTKEVKLLDFGLVRGPQDVVGKNRRTQFQTFLGTPEFVSPEQAQDARGADIRADIYSLGCTLYFLLAGHPPFRRESAVEVLLAHVTDEATPLKDVRPDLPAGLSAVVARMMAKAPGDRYQTPAEAALALRPFLQAAANAEESATRTVPPPLPAEETMVSTHRPRPLAVGATGGRRWRHLILAVFAGGLIAALVAGVVLAWSDGDQAVEVKLNERGCRLSIDGQKLNLDLQVEGDSLPVRLVPGAEYSLRAEKEGFEPEASRFVYREGGPKVWSVTMRPKPPAEGKLILQVDEPGAEVYVNGEKKGQVVQANKPVVLVLKAGGHTVEVWKPGFETFRKAVTVKAGQDETLRVRLGPAAPPGKSKRFTAKVPDQWKNAWRVEGAELVQSSKANHVTLAFGDLEWKDYVFSVEALRVSGTDGFGLQSRFLDGKPGYTYIVGGWNNGWLALAQPPGPGIPDRPVGKVLKTWPEFAAGLEFGRWFRAKVSVIGDKGQCHLDDKRTQSFRADRYPKGSVGLWTNRSQYRFRNIKVTSADGKAVLLEGVPDLQVAR